MAFLKSCWRDERGIATVLVAVMGTVLLGMAGLAVDIGLAYLNKARLQAAVDAAALAGAQELPGVPGSAQEFALAYARMNGLAPEEVEAVILDGGMGVKVNASRRTPFFFAPAVGIESGMVAAEATARVGTLVAARGAVPVGVEEQQFSREVRYVLKEGGSGETVLGSGNYGILEVDKYPHWYGETLINGSSQMIRVGDILLTASGVRSGDTYDGISARLLACRNVSCSPQDFERDCPRVMLVPVYHPLGDKNNIVEVEIVGFANFWVEAVTGNGNTNDIAGYFVETVSTGLIDLQRLGYGAYGERLVK